MLFFRLELFANSPLISRVKMVKFKLRQKLINARLHIAVILITQEFILLQYNTTHSCLHYLYLVYIPQNTSCQSRPIPGHFGCCYPDSGHLLPSTPQNSHHAVNNNHHLFSKSTESNHTHRYKCTIFLNYKCQTVLSIHVIIFQCAFRMMGNVGLRQHKVQSIRILKKLA